MTLTSVEYKEKDNMSLERFTLGDHYTVEKLTTRFESGQVWKRYTVNVSYEDRHYNYIPEISYNEDLLGEEAPKFEIQTTAYGALGTDEIQKVIAGYQEAVKAVEILTKNFC